MPDILLITEQEKIIKSLKRRMENWREFFVALYPVLTWSQPWYPVPIIGVISTLFLMYWYWDPPIISSVSLFFMIYSLMECVVPKICGIFCTPQQWTAVKEKRYELMCESIVKSQNMIYNQTSHLKVFKASNPKMYFLSFFSFCSFVAWLGYKINNWLIGYSIVTFIALYPGMRHNHVMENFFSTFIHRITDGIRSFSQKDTAKNN